MSEAILPRPQGLNSRGIDVSLLLARRVSPSVGSAVLVGRKPIKDGARGRMQLRRLPDVPSSCPDSIC